MSPRARIGERATDSTRTRWIQLGLGLLCMMAISSPQYVWTLFTKPLMAKLGVTLAQLQVTFSILIVLQTFLSPAQGWLIERFGLQRLLALGALLTGLSWIAAAAASSLIAVFCHGPGGASRSSCSAVSSSIGRMVYESHPRLGLRM